MSWNELKSAQAGRSCRSWILLGVHVGSYPDFVRVLNKPGNVSLAGTLCDDFVESAVIG
jgi:hypothetical protein